MNKLIRIPRENYVTPEIATLTAEVSKLHRRISKKARAMLDLYAEAGFKLLKIKEQLGHGCWSKWLDEHFPASRETARAYIRVAENWTRLQAKFRLAKANGKQLGLAQALALLRIESLPIESELKGPRTPMDNRWRIEAKECRRSLAKRFAKTMSGWDDVDVIFLARHSWIRGFVLQDWMGLLQQEISSFARIVVESEDEIERRFYESENWEEEKRELLETAKNKILAALPERDDLTPLQKAFMEDLLHEHVRVLAAAHDSDRQDLERRVHKHSPARTLSPKKKKSKPDQIVGLVTCGDSKEEEAVPARDLYKGTGFKCAARWAQENCTQWFILSAEHGLLHPDKVTEPYNTYLPKLSKEEQRAWAEKVRKQLATIKLPLVYLGGKDYLEILNAGQSKLPIIDLFKAIEVSNRGKRASWLKHNPKLTNELREKLGLPLKQTAKVDKKTIAKPTKHKQTKQTTPTQ